jgi:prepilin-type N-terminal cleavage/methylation domain-containing protein
LRHPIRQEGFTLIELLVSMGLTFMLLAAVYSVYRVQVHTVKVQEKRQEAQEYARAVVDIMVREIRNAGNNPLEATSGTNCAGTPTAGLPGIVTATSTSFAFTYDYRSSGSPSTPDGHCNSADEEITYAYQTPGPQSCPSGTGDIVRSANGTTEPLTDCNVSAFSLAYYAKDASTVMSPVVAANIQRVKMTITVQSKDPDGEFGGQVTSTVYSNIDLRNRGL